MYVNKCLPYPVVTFTARNKDIRKADDIRRNAVREFPMLSSTTFWKYAQMREDGSTKTKKVKLLFEALRMKVWIMRLDAANKNAKEGGPPCFEILAAMKKHKCGNCAEFAVGALAGLYANGYDDSEINRLCLETKIINENTGKTEYTKVTPLDHEFVTTTMGKHSDKQRDKIVVDSWLGFTDSWSGAMGKFDSVFENDKLRIEEKVLCDFLDYSNEPQTDDSYKIKSRYTVKEAEDEVNFPYDKTNFLLKTKYPGLKPDTYA